MKKRSGITHQGRSHALERALTDFGAEESYGESAERFEEHYGRSVNRATIRRVTMRWAEQAEQLLQSSLEAERTGLEEPLSERPGVDQMLVELDGRPVRAGMLERIDEEETTPDRGLLRHRRREDWKEVQVALARPLESPQRTYVSAMASYPEIVSSLFDAAVSRGLSFGSETIAVADGGNGLKEELEAQFPNVTFIVDHAHLLGYLYETGDAMGLDEEDRREWVRRQSQRIDAGKVLEVITEFTRHRGPGHDRARRLSGYLRRFRGCVDYDAYRARELPIGSGEVESARRSIPQKRLKKPGACWKPENVNPMLALRVLRADGQWEHLSTHKRPA